MTLVIVVGTGMVGGVTGCTNVCCFTVMLLPGTAAKAFICWVTQAVAAPMPRAGSVWLDAVCLVPNETSVWMVALMRLGSICLNRASRAGSGARRWGRPDEVPPDAALAAVACETMGTAAAATAEADRNRRRLGPFEPEASVLSMS